VKILLVDDDADLRAVLSFALRDAGYLVSEAVDGATARQQASDVRPDLVILDLNLGPEEGLELLPALRQSPGDPSAPARPVLVLSVRASEEDVVAALDRGADDHLAKPFSPRTLLARVRALLRRSGIDRPEPLAVGVFQVELDRRQVTISAPSAAGASASHRLTPLELRLLQFLLARAGETVPSDRLLTHIWGGRGTGDRQLLKQLVHRLRQKIEPDPAAPRYLVNVAGEGYRLET
jgi:DNA-binding response OmpR family regulator